MPLRESIRALRARAKELKLRTKAHLGDYEAREKIKALEEFKRRHGIDKLSPEAYDFELKHFKSRLEFIASQKQQLEEIEKRMKERGIELTPYQRKLLSDLKRIAGKDPWAIWQLLGAVQTADAWRTEIAKSIKAAERAKGSSWGTYLLMLAPKTPVRKRYLDIYRDARLFGLPKRMIGRLMRTFEEDYSGKLAKSLLPSIAIANSDYVRRIAKTRTLQSARYDFKKSAELAELLAAMAEITSGRKILGEIVGHAVGSYDRSREGDAAKLWQYIQEHAKEIYGKEIEDVTIRGRHHERIERIKSAKKAAVETLKKHLEDIDSKIEERKKVLERYKNDPDRKKIIEGQIKALEEKRSEAMRAAAREILALLIKENIKKDTQKGGEDVVLERFKRIGRKIRERIGKVQERKIEGRGAPKQPLLRPPEKPKKEGPTEVKLLDLIRDAHDHAAANVLPSNEVKKLGIVIPETMHRALYEELRKKGIISNSVRVDQKQREELKKIITTVLVRELQRGVKLDSKILKDIEAVNIQKHYNEKREVLKRINDLESKHDRIKEGIKTKMNEIEGLQYALTKLLGRGIMNYSDERKLEQLLKTAKRAVAKGKYRTIGEYFEDFYKKNGGKLHQNVDKIIIEQYLKRLKDAENYVIEKEAERQTLLQEIKQQKMLLKDIEKNIERVRAQALNAKATAIVKINRQIAQRLAEEMIKAHKLGKFEFVGPKVKSVASVKGQKW